MVGVRKSPVVYRLGKSSDALSARAVENGTALGRGSSLLGLTLNRYDLQVSVEADGEPAEAGYCARLRSASIVIAARPEVLVDRRFSRGTCQQRAILEHENHHVAVFREAIGHYLPVIEATLRSALPLSLRVPTNQEARDGYARVIRVALIPSLDAIRSRAQDGNRSLDTAQNYARLFRRCASW